MSKTAKCPQCGETRGWHRADCSTFLKERLAASQALNAELLAAAEEAEVYIASDEVSHGRTFRAGNALRAAIAKCEAKP